ncbi:MAG: hypothetical protein IIC41_01830 [Candidatus Marinimicrobia bacterium]|nr:hypothetical protein [Candidatus Neomarinimicrobiota bacterium]
MSFTRQVSIIVLLLLVVLAVVFSRQILETNRRGQYQIKQAAITGTMTVRMAPGMYGRWFGAIDTWNKAETFYFTSEYDGAGDVAEDRSMEVRFNDGSLTHISGTARITMPTGEQDALNLIIKEGYRNYRDLEQKLILPTVRNALRSTANLMSARESYSEKRLDFINWARDQIQNGLYSTEEITRKVTDIVSGEQVTRTFKRIKRNEATGEPVYLFNPMAGLGISISNFEIKTFNYAAKVQVQIAAQQEALMAVETARARAKEAEQKAITVEAEGKAEVMRVKYEKEQSKIAAVVLAEQRLEVARLERQAAEETRQRDILLGQGEAERKRLVMAADGALAQKLETFEKIQGQWAAAYAQRNVPQLVMGGAGADGGTDRGTLDFSQAMQLLVAKQLGLDLSIPAGAGVAQQPRQ